MTFRLLSTLALVLLLALPSSFVNAAKKGAAPGGHLKITQVFHIDSEAAEQLLISGEHFDFGSGRLVVTLGDAGELPILSESASEISVEIPTLPDGDYLLSVFRQGGQSQGDEFDFSLRRESSASGQTTGYWSEAVHGGEGSTHFGFSAHQLHEVTSISLPEGSYLVSGKSTLVKPSSAGPGTVMCCLHEPGAINDCRESRERSFMGLPTHGDYRLMTLTAGFSSDQPFEVLLSCSSATGQSTPDGAFAFESSMSAVKVDVLETP